MMTINAKLLDKKIILSLTIRKEIYKSSMQTGALDLLQRKMADIILTFSRTLFGSIEFNYLCSLVESFNSPRTY